MDDKDAQLLLLTLNRLHGEDNPRKRAELLQAALTEFEHPELLSLIPETQDDLADLLALLELEEREMEATLKKMVEDDEATLPVILDFVLTPAEAAQVQATLQAFQPTGNPNPSAALVALCAQAERPNPSA